VSDSSRYPIPARIHRVEETIKRSRFTTTVAHAPDADAAHSFVARMREEFPDATHNCWAFVAGPPGSMTHIGMSDDGEPHGTAGRPGPPGSMTHIGMSDDGEPHGTAGRPMLTSLLHGGVGEIVAVCTRYFGGVKLGTGGLSRAYSGGVKLALESLVTEEKVDRVRVTVTIGYADVDAVQRLFDEMEIEVDTEDYGAEVVYQCGVPEPTLWAFRSAIADATRGAGSVSDVGE